MGVDGVNGLSKGTSYDDSDVEGMKGKESLSTNTLINRVGNHAGLGDTHNVRGTDKTGAQLIEEHREAQQDKWIDEFVELLPGGDEASTALKMHQSLKNGDLGKALHEGDTYAATQALEKFAAKTLEHVGFGTAEHAVKIPFEIAKFGLAMATSVADDGELGQERKEAIVKSAMHIAVLGSLSGLPQEFVNNERSRYVADKDGVALANKMNAGGRDNSAMAVIQLHCDQGISAARAMFTANQTPDAYLKAHPEVGKRFAEDPAFQAGFKGAMYAKEHGQYDAMMKSLDQRDARFEAHHVAWRA